MGLFRFDGEHLHARGVVVHVVAIEQFDHPGVNVGRGGDDTLFALESGILRFERWGRNRKRASVYPKAEA